MSSVRFLAIRQYAGARGAVNAERERFFFGQRAGIRWGAESEAAVSRRLVWLEQQRFRGFGCSDCDWRFEPSGAPIGTSFDEMMHKFELQRDKEFASHVCADYPRAKSAKEQQR